MKLNGSTDNWNNEGKLMEDSCIDEMHNFRAKRRIDNKIVYDLENMRNGQRDESERNRQKRVGDSEIEGAWREMRKLETRKH